MKDTCALPVEDTSFQESRLISMSQCNYCKNDSCKSYWIDLDCIIYQITAYEESVDKDPVENNIGGCLKENLKNNMKK
jgi:hypothetical protein